MKYLLFLSLLGILNLYSHADDIVEITGEDSVSQEDIDSAMNDTLILSGSTGVVGAGSGLYTYKTLRKNSRLQQGIQNLDERTKRINQQNAQITEKYKNASPRLKKKNPLKTQSTSWSSAKRRQFKRNRLINKYGKVPLSGTVSVVGLSVSLSQVYFGFEVATDDLDEISDDENCCVNTELEGLPLGGDLEDELEVIYRYTEDN